MDPKYKWYRVSLKGPDHQHRLYHFRGLTRREHAVARGRENLTDGENYVLTCCVLEELDFNVMLAGTCQKLLELIYVASGLTEESSTFADALEWIQSEAGALEAASVAMIPSLTLEHLDSCDPSYYAKYLILGKFQFETMYGIPVEKAFLPASETGGNNPDPNFSPQPGQFPTPGPGERAKFVEDSFTWKRQR